MDPNSNTGNDAPGTEPLEPLEMWAPPTPGTAYATATTPVSTVAATPTQDPWTSPLWGRPDTVGGFWGAPDPGHRIERLFEGHHAVVERLLATDPGGQVARLLLSLIHISEPTRPY